jgi:hypothetical protein
MGKKSTVLLLGAVVQDYSSSYGEVDGGGTLQLRNLRADSILKKKKKK